MENGRKENLLSPLISRYGIYSLIIHVIQERGRIIRANALLTWLDSVSMMHTYNELL